MLKSGSPTGPARQLALAVSQRTFPIDACAGCYMFLVATLPDTGDLAVTGLQLCDRFQPSNKRSKEEQSGQGSRMVEKVPSSGRHMSVSNPDAGRSLELD
jgi:hypothetical protein